MVVQHILDCLAAAAALVRRRAAAGRASRRCRQRRRICPAVVIAMRFPTVVVTCIDSVGKKAAFITQAAGALGLKNVKAVACARSRASPTVST